MYLREFLQFFDLYAHAYMEPYTLFKKDYPYLLRQITKLPDSLEVIGHIPSDEHLFLCVIGSRNNSTYGFDACKKIIYELKGYPVVIVSGLAIGIDSIAHQTAVEAGLKTIAFPGSGLGSSVLYPRSRRGLAKRIVEAGGALISPFERYSPAQEYTFPVRNRLMAGMCHATLIIEGKRGSGSIITTTYSLEFGRDVLAIPGSIFGDLSYGPNMLIRRGAAAVTSGRDVLECLGVYNAITDPAELLKKETVVNKPQYDQLDISNFQKQIIECLTIENMSASELATKLHAGAEEIVVNFSELEIMGLVRELDGKYRLT